MFLDSKNCFVHSQKHLVALLGVKDLLVVATEDAILVTTEKHSQDVRKITAHLQQQAKPFGKYL